MSDRRSARPVARAAAILIVLSTGAAGGGCGVGDAQGGPIGDSAVVVVQVPSSAPHMESRTAVHPDRVYPDGSRVVVLPERGRTDGAVVLSRGLLAAGAPAVAPRGDAVLFAAKPEAGARWSIYEADPRSGRHRLLLRAQTDCTEPDYLAQRIVVACADADTQSGSPAPRWALYTVSWDGEDLQRMTFGPFSAQAPLALRDGRILFLMWSASPHGGAGARFAPFTLNPDGTLLEAYAGDEPGNDAPLLGNVERDPEWRALEAIPLVVTPAPRGRPSSVDPNSTTGMLVGYDASRSDGIVGPPIDGPTPTEVLLQTIAAAPHASSAPGAGAVTPRTVGDRPPGRDVVDLGTAVVAPDRSFFLEVPADTPLRVRTLDADGTEIATSSWFWVRPGEVRACFGCHEGHRAAPVNRPIEAITRRAVRVPAHATGGGG
ncbi:MAG: hypothetical protein PVJ49_05275 [Acidobacteriota bacterium]|jgi:hypothetical protein